MNPKKIGCLCFFRGGGEMSCFDQNGYDVCILVKRRKGEIVVRKTLFWNLIPT